MAHRLSHLLLGLTLCLLVPLVGCGDDETETQSPIAEEPTPMQPDTAAADTLVANQPVEAGQPAGPGRPATAEAPPATTSSETEPQVELHADFPGTTDTVEGPGTGASAGTLARIRTARHADFDRIVFEFSDGGVPSYQLNYIEGPLYRCGTGGLVDLPGEAILAVEMSPAEPTTAEGLLAVANVGRIANLPVIEEHAMVCDEGGHVSWILGLNTTSRYRAFTLENPSRLVVDLRHGS